ncbi:MAG: metallophosphoesterase [Clostridia bacterium]|nr:metallophosphoesterase [Clostridia bacterium]
MKEIIIGGVLVLTAILILIMTSCRLKKRKYTVASKKIFREITAVLISDLHESRFGKRQGKLLQMVKVIAPDIIFITGDMVEDERDSYEIDKMFSDENPAKMLLRALPEIAPCYMVLGNHEANIPNVGELADAIEELGIRVLHRHDTVSPDVYEEITVKSQKILLCGADDPHYDRQEPCHKKTLIERIKDDKNRNGQIITAWRERLTREYSDVGERDCLTVLLSHRPEEYELYRKLGFDAAFSGHTHGGQWRLPPFINGVYAPNQGLFPRHAGGCYRYDGFVHIVSRGLTKKRMIRIFNRPEIPVVRFVPKSAINEK